jgi:hypothetical protein
MCRLLPQRERCAEVRFGGFALRTTVAPLPEPRGLSKASGLWCFTCRADRYRC